ncbi:MAG: ribonuclease P protein component [Proteobacteria bacterium]|nr:ribonuclease P protein component [Pseudomonadota bacterium]
MLYDKLKSKKSFISLRKRGGSYVAPAFVILVTKLDNNSEKLKVGFTASKKIGNAVVRAKSRRRLRAAFQEINPEIINAFEGFEFNIIARYKSLTVDFEKLNFYFRKTLGNIKKDYEKKD